MPHAARFALVAAFAACAWPAAAEGPNVLGASRDWTAYQADTAGGKVCYAVSAPTAVTPKRSSRDPAFFIISTWPSRNVSDELQIIPGYQYKDGVPVFAEIGTVKVEFFTQNDGQSGLAWVKNQNDEAALVKAMRSGAELTVTGESTRGWKTTDTYSLAGLESALSRVHSACGK